MKMLKELALGFTALQNSLELWESAVKTCMLDFYANKNKRLLFMFPCFRSKRPAGML